MPAHPGWDAANVARIAEKHRRLARERSAAYVAREERRVAKAAQAKVSKSGLTDEEAVGLFDRHLLSHDLTEEAEWRKMTVDELMERVRLHVKMLRRRDDPAWGVLEMYQPRTKSDDTEE